MKKIILLLSTLTATLAVLTACTFTIDPRWEQKK